MLGEVSGGQVTDNGTAIVPSSSMAGGLGRVANTTSGTTPMISGVTVVDKWTGAVYKGTVDLQPTLDRIANGGAPLSKNDGTTFKNRPVNGVELLPIQPIGYYKEYVVPTPGVNGPGPQRIITGKGGEIYYTPDHYDSFIPIKK
ncbi:ribonuclease domain-containing protein [Burkholderia ubonensis]